MSGFDRAVSLLPQTLRRFALEISESERQYVEELRLRIGTPPSVLVSGVERVLESAPSVTRRDLTAVLEFATGASAHSARDSISRGFVTVRGGCRIGLCGTAVMEGGGISGLRELSSAAIRIPSEMHGCADELFSRLFASGLRSTIILSPPGLGKTTLLRELVRLVSNTGVRVALADERGEVAACFEGEPQLDVGACTDVLTSAPKAQGTMLLLRSMNPQLLAMDEITAAEDIIACETAANCGVRLLATAHAESVRDLKSRALYRKLLDLSVFRSAVTIARHGAQRRYILEDLSSW